MRRIPRRRLKGLSNSALNRRGERLEIYVGWEVGEIVLCSPEARRSPTSQTSSPGIGCMPLSPFRCSAPSAKRTAAKRAFKGPFVPYRQASVRRFALPSMSSAATDRTLGTCRLRWAAAPGDAGDELDLARVDLPVTGEMPTAQASPRALKA